VILAAIAAPAEGVRGVLPGLVAAALAGSLVDLPVLRWRTGSWQFPSGAILTGLLVAMVLSPHEAWWIVAVTTAVGVASKYILRTKSANVFNPAALAIVATFYVFNTGQSWWGAMPNASPIAVALAVLFATGIFIADRVKKMPLVLAFLGVYYLLFTITAFVGDPRIVSEIYRTPDLQAVLFFAFFILTDPPTSPVRQRPQIICGVLVAIVSYGIFEFVGAVYYLLAGVLVGNVYEAWRRQRMRSASI
jgi:enediyne biosynthesis protein E5